MYKFSFSIVLLLIICFKAKAQNVIDYFDGSHPFVGLLVLGMNTSEVYGDSYDGYHKVGLNVGGKVYVNINKKFGLSMEILYSQKGSVGVRNSSDLQVGSYIEHYKLKLNYVEVPLLLNFYKLSSINNLFLSVGASYGALMNNTETYDNPYYIINSFPDSFAVNKYLVDGLIGVSYVWQRFVLEGRFQYSITPIRKWKNAPSQAYVPGRDERSSLFVFRLGYLF